MKRLWLIDFLRGLAVAMMVIFHAFFYIDYFGFAKIELYSGIIGRFQMIIPLLFIFLSGISSRLHLKKKGKKKAFFRGLKILGYAMIITLSTLLLFPDFFIFFGILHLIGSCIILSIFFGKISALAFGAIILFISNIVNNSVVQNKYLSILGLNYPMLNTFDYYPLVPWLGIFLIGSFSSIFAHKLKSFSPKNNIINFFCIMGRHSLFIYFAHLIVLFSFFYILKYFFA